MKTKFLAAMMLTALFATVGATAQEIEQPQKKEKGGMLKKFDTDADGRISKEEAEKGPKGKLKDNFTAIDTNKDAYLDKAELKAFFEVKSENKKVRVLKKQQ